MGHLSGIRVLDFSRVMAGPYCTALLADLGAEVVKIESPAGGDDARKLGPFVNGHSVYFALLNRNKRSITLDLKSQRAQEIVLKLAERADVVVENFRPGVTTKLGVDYERLAAVNPRLVYLSLSGFGQTGPYVDRPAYDLIIQAMAGLMSVTGTLESGPTAVGDTLGDVTAGLMGSWAVLAALQGRATSGRGDYIDLAMFDMLRGLQLTRLAQLFAYGKAPVPVGNRHPVTVPCDTFRTQDGWIALVIPSDAHFGVLARLMEQPALASDARFATYDARSSNERALKPIIEAWSQRFATDALVERCLAAGLSAGPVWDHAQVARSEQAHARGLITPTPHPAFGAIPYATQPARFQSEAPSPARPEPTLGADTELVLRELAGISAAEFSALRAARVI